jgi:hypothetical protein
LADLEFTHLQQREDHWAIVDLIGKGGHIRTVPMPDWVKTTIDVWVASAGISAGRLFRCVCRAGKHWGDGVTERAVWQVVKQYAKKLGFGRLAPHDLRRYAESRTMPNQNATTSLRACEMGAERYRLLRTMRHSPVVAGLGEKRNSGPPDRQTLSSTPCTQLKKTGCLSGLAVGPRCYLELRNAPTSGPHLTNAHGNQEQDYAASRTVQPLADGLERGQFGIVRDSA